MDVGEGSLVAFVGYVKDGSYAQPESVNCQRTGQENFDVHVNLVAKRTDSRCKGIVVEMIPHSRPPAWTPDAIKAVKVPVRVKGHLFFDSPHAPCRPNGTIPKGNSRGLPCGRSTRSSASTSARTLRSRRAASTKIRIR